MVGAAFLLSYPAGRGQRCSWRKRTQERAGRRVASYPDEPTKVWVFSPANLCADMYLGSRPANGTQPPSVAQYDILSAKIVISIRALSGIVERPSQPTQGLGPTDPNMSYVLDHPKATLPVASSTQRIGGCTRESRYIANRTRPTHSACSTIQ